MTYEEILTAYPELEKDDILQAIQYASRLSNESIKPLIKIK